MSQNIHRDHVIQRTQELIRIPTVNPPGNNYQDIKGYLVTELNLIGMEVEVINTGSNYPIILGWLNRGANPELHFNCHYDVVPAGNNWSVPPFDGVIRNGKIYGRGAADMKGGIACIMSVIEAIRRDCQMKGCLSISLVPDEETGGIHGTEELIKKSDFHPDMVIIPEPSFPKIHLGHKGVIQLLIEIGGKEAHAAMPTFGKSAFERMIEIVSKLIKEWGVENGVVNARSRISYPEDADQFFLPTMTLGGICSSGDAVNAVPGKCTFTIDRRFMPVENSQEVLESLEAFFQSFEYCQVNKLLMADASLMSREEASILLDPMQKMIKKVWGAYATEAISAGFMDTRFFRKKWNIPCLAYGPGDSGIAHTPNEFVKIERLIKVGEIFYSVIQELLS